MAYSSIVKPGDYFEATTYTGGATDVSSLSFQPDFVWAKKRSGSENHGLFDAVRGATKTLSSNDTAAESTRSGSLTSFDSDGWSMGGSDGIISASGSTYVGWAWKANGSGSANTDGTISSTVSASATSGFSIVTWNGNSGTVGHGLGVKPDFIVVKSRQTGGSNNWVATHSALGTNMNDNYIILNSTGVAGSGSNTWGGEPTAQHFTVSGSVAANDNNVAYCFAGKKGYSKFGSYIGNGNVDGTFVYTGFKPAFVIVKNSTTGNYSWTVNDTARTPSNVMDKWLYPNSNTGEATGSNYNMDLLSNGFKSRNTGSNTNDNNNGYIYIAIAGEPLVANSGSNGVPATAR